MEQWEIKVRETKPGGDALVAGECVCRKGKKKEQQCSWPGETPNPQNTASSCRLGEAAEHSGLVRCWKDRVAKRRGHELTVGM